MENLRYGDHVGEDGVWAQLLNRPSRPGLHPVLFLDRDGVLVEEVHYLHKVEEMRLSPGAAATIRHANRAGVPVVVVTNQAGIARGLYGWPEFEAVQEAMLDALDAFDAFVNAVIACPFHENGVPPWNLENHPDRKPNPGMLRRAAEIIRIDMGRSWIVGDRAGDMGAGKNAKIAGGMHVLDGHGSADGERAAALALADSTFQVVGGDGIADAVSRIPLFDPTRN